MIIEQQVHDYRRKGKQPQNSREMTIEEKENDHRTVGK